tara:strand:+ start:588 stop:779 length:192 start_codon:yes stop_codon:yes gene_type:complete
MPAGDTYKDNITSKIDITDANITNGLKVLKLLIPDESIIIDSLSLPIVFNTNTVEIKSPRGKI